MPVDPNGARPATPDEAGPLTATLAEAFLADPVSQWIFPDRAERERVHPYFFRPFLERALQLGEVNTVGAYDGVALWLPVDPDDSDDDPEELLALLRPGLGTGSLQRFASLDEQMRSNHPQQMAHAYLPFVGVRPDRQAAGVGAALLGHRLAELDGLGRAAYLEASSPRNQLLYARLGFRRTGTTLTPPGGPPLFPMWREPARAPGA